MVVWWGLLFGWEYRDKQKQVIEEYKEDLADVVAYIRYGVNEAKDCGNLIESVWSNATQKERDAETDKYTFVNGCWVDDPNDALENLFSDPSFQSKISFNEKEQRAVSDRMLKLKNPPEKYKDAHDTLLKLYDAYNRFIYLVDHPTGDLLTFSNKFNELYSELDSLYRVLQTYHVYR